jgi:dephospho-CoA kinase
MPSFSRLEIALTGGIACGKSTVAEMLRARGWQVIDTDLIARRALDPAETKFTAYKNVVDAFGPNILQADKSIDRKVLGRLVFADPALRARLNELTHPVIRSAWQHEREERGRTHPQHHLAVMIPLLYECELEAHFRAVWCVGTSRATQLSRLLARGHDAAEATQRIASQWPVAEKMARASAVFWNEGSVNALERQVQLFA